MATSRIPLFAVTGAIKNAAAVAEERRARHAFFLEIECIEDVRLHSKIVAAFTRATCATTMRGTRCMFFSRHAIGTSA